MENASNKETLLKHYEILIDTYKYYLELVLKFNTFYFAIAGAIVSYYLSQPNSGYMPFALGLPILMGLLLAGFAFIAAYWVNPLGHELDRVKDLLGFEAIPSVSFLKLLLYLSGVFFSVIAICLIVLWIVRPLATTAG